MTRLAVLALAFSLAGSMTVSAQKGKKQKDQPHKDTPQHAKVNVAFTGSQRDAVRTYFVGAHGRGNCPPGLAKKNNGCLPPGQAKKRYAVGQPLPSDIRIGELPRDLSTRIGPLPSGYRYGMVDGDVIMITISSRLVMDVIDAYIR
jgi:Ni/Co efflux regulator RcnB